MIVYVKYVVRFNVHKTLFTCIHKQDFIYYVKPTCELRRFLASHARTFAHSIFGRTHIARTCAFFQNFEQHTHVCDCACAFFAKIRSFARSDMNSYQSRNYTTTQQDFVLPPYSHNVILPYGRTVIQLYCCTVVQSYGRTVIQSYSCTVVPQYSNTAVRSYFRMLVCWWCSQNKNLYFASYK